MCATILSEKTVKIRKKRRCDQCLDVYEVGSFMLTFTYPDMGKIWRSYQCKRCSAFAATQDHDDVCDSGILLRDFDEYAEFKAKYDSKVTNPPA
jgi:predicted RNA-binding Zn-ribbon protein involved in translation (DUF1610 family)